MQPRTRTSKFVRSLVESATVRPMLFALLDMKRARVLGGAVAAPSLPPVEVAKAA
jgi:hypothetical protein